MLCVKNLSHGFYGKAGQLPVLQDVSFSIAGGELCALTGSSGSGKTTLMNLVGLLDRPNEGEIILGGTKTSNLDINQAAALRNQFLGFIFQSFHLLPHLTALDNVALPLVYRGMNRRLRRDHAAATLTKVGLADRIGHRPDQMSGGQRQRVAIARALVGEPKLLLADEPTGNLDSQSADEVLSLFLNLNHQTGLTVLIVTHDPTIAIRCPRRLVMRDGKLLDDNRGVLRSLEAST